MPGRNGMLLYVGSLLWWGEAAVAAEDTESLLQDWRCTVEDVAAVLEVVCNTVGAANGDAAAKAKGASAAKKGPAMQTMRKTPDSPPDPNKENRPLRKHTCTSR
ncbi:hypothetical protein B0H13DRAFT_2336684 [Mycena leptocephala]|nr:hypothetical protein B0H13DRAFT_2336684 [Mycena leptocephala]